MAATQTERGNAIVYVQFRPLALSKRLRLIVLTALLTACGGPVRDADPRIGGLIHRCFATVKESIFLSGRCQAIDGWPYCDTVKSLNPVPHPEWKFPQLPPTLQDFQADPAFWTGQIHVQQNYFYRKHGDHLVVYGGLPIGTRLEIVQVSRWFNGENGTFWIAYANIQEGEFTGRRILLPWQGFDSHGWIHAEYDPTTTKDPEVDSEYLTKCEAKATDPNSNSR